MLLLKPTAYLRHGGRSLNARTQGPDTYRLPFVHAAQPTASSEKKSCSSSLADESIALSVHTRSMLVKHFQNSNFLDFQFSGLLSLQGVRCVRVWLVDCRQSPSTDRACLPATGATNRACYSALLLFESTPAVPLLVAINFLVFSPVQQQQYSNAYGS